MKPCVSFVAVLAMFCLVFLVPAAVAASPARCCGEGRYRSSPASHRRQDAG
jgi:hypothetical protein